MKIKALTLFQPWASFMALGLKRNETRSWSTSYRGPLAIHAAAKIPQDFPLQILEWAPASMGGSHEWPKGKILCVVDLVEILTTTAMIPFINHTEFMLGNYSSGRFAWSTKMIQAFAEPIPCKGHQGLWDWEWEKGEK